MKRISLFLLLLLSFSLVNASDEKSTGLLSASYKVDPSEYISKKRLMGGATVSLVQAETSDLNVLIGDIYELEGYTFLWKFWWLFYKRCFSCWFKGWLRTY